MPSYSSYLSFCNQQVVGLGDCKKGVSKALLIILLECTKIAIQTTRLNWTAHSSEHTMHDKHEIRQGASRFRKQLNLANSLDCQNSVLGVSSLACLHDQHRFFSSNHLYNDTNCLVQAIQRKYKRRSVVLLSLSQERKIIHIS